jgi:lipoic acid synthetase
LLRPRMPGRFSDRHQVKVLLRRCGLHTVCEEARCPNIAHCFGRATATFLIMGDRCTRNCAFCAIEHGPPPPLDTGEPSRVAQAASALGLRHVVITSVTRDDLPDGGAGHFRQTVLALRRVCPEATLEVLVPDFNGDSQSLELLLESAPDVFNHNLETVPRLYRQVRPGAEYRRSLALLERAAARGACLIKSGLMVGLGEQEQEILEVFSHLKDAGCRVVTVGQYLQPRKDRLQPVALVGEEEFNRLRQAGGELGLKVVAGPLVRSSWHAEEIFTMAK